MNHSRGIKRCQNDFDHGPNKKIKSYNPRTSTDDMIRALSESSISNNHKLVSTINDLVQTVDNLINELNNIQDKNTELEKRINNLEKKPDLSDGNMSPKWESYIG